MDHAARLAELSKSAEGVGRGRIAYGVSVMPLGWAVEYQHGFRTSRRRVRERGFLHASDLLIMQCLFEQSTVGASNDGCYRFSRKDRAGRAIAPRVAGRTGAGAEQCPACT